MHDMHMARQLQQLLTYYTFNISGSTNERCVQSASAYGHQMAVLYQVLNKQVPVPVPVPVVQVRYQYKYQYLTFKYQYQYQYQYITFKYQYQYKYCA